VWNFDQPQIDRILDSQARVTPLEAIVVRSAGHVHARVRDANRRFVASHGAFPTDGLVMEERPIVYGGDPIGTVRIYTTPRLFEEQIRGAMVRTVLAILVVDVLIVLFVYLVLWRWVLRPIVEIERFAAAVSDEGTTTAPALSPAPTSELESLRVSIETMVNLLEHRYAELQEHTARRFESEERFHTIFNSVTDAIIIFDPETGAILDVNEGFCTMMGYTAEEARGYSSGAFASGVGTFQPEVAIARIRELGPDEHVVAERQVRRKDGQLLSVEVSLRTAAVGGARRVISVVRDITQRKTMEDALRRSETMSAMGSLVAGVAHEVRNPLFGMSALLDAYAEEMTTPDLQDLASRLREQIGRLTQLMRELLEFGRPVQITPVPDSLPRLVDEVVQSRASHASSANVTLRTTLAADLPDTFMDRARLRQVFENVIDNALQHAPPVRAITVSATPITAGERTWVECTVEDDGTGFQIADLGRVFEPFFTRRERGIGLGMSIVQRIVEEHGGRVTAGNRPEGGAVITMRLPV
jgi:PAS domain S-box-containing protein